MESDVVIIGGGDSGLSTAYQLKKQGYQVVVLEKSDVVGGRARTYCFEDVCVDTNAQFLASFYKEAFQLLDELGLADDKVALPGKSAIVKGKKTFGQDAKGILFSNLIPFWEKLKLIKVVLLTLWYSNKLTVDDLTRSVQFDTQSANEYATAQIGPVAAENIVATMLRSFFYWNSQKTTNALLLYLLRYAFFMKLYKLENGIGSIAKTLADHVDVRLKHKVTSAEVDPSTGTWLVTAQHHDEATDRTLEVQFTTRVVVSAFQAPNINPIFPNLPPELKDFFGKITYTHNATTHLFLKGHINPLAYTHLSYVPETSPNIANITFDNGFSPESSKTGAKLTVLSVFPSSQFSESMMEMPEDEAIEALIAELHKLYPFENLNIKEKLVHARIVRVQNALPNFPTGYIHRLKNYRDDLSCTLPPGMFVAGAFLGNPSIEGAILAGNLELPSIISYLSKGSVEASERLAA
ncbi:MAG: FAD-dependent oxidoreductase [Chloroflexota bacterium]